MAQKRDQTEEIIPKLREAEVLLGPGKSFAEACRQICVTDNTYYGARSTGARNLCEGLLPVIGIDVICDGIP